MLIIRLQRTGKKNQADFRIVLAEKEAPVKKKITEVLGNYNPRKKTFQVKEERLKYWLGQKVSLSETAHNLLVSKGLLDAKKVKAFTIPKKPVEPATDKPSSAEATEDKPAAVETPAEVAEATAEVELKVEEEPVEIPSSAPDSAEATSGKEATEDKPAAEESKPIAEAETTPPPAA
jgi:small subunit ribosomal protein S16